MDPQNIFVAIATLGVVFGGAIQSITVPKWIDSFGNNLGGPYFILAFSSSIYTPFFLLSFIIIFSVYATKHSLSKAMELIDFSPKSFAIFVLIGFFDALNGMMVIYASPPNRTPPILQAIFPNVAVFYSIVGTLLFIPSKSINYFHWSPILAMVLVLLAVFLNVLPYILNHVPFASGKDPAAWAFIFMLGVAPGVWYNNLQERYLTDQWFHSSPSPSLVKLLYATWCLFWGCLFQQLFVLACFWIDFIPWYGTSSDITSFYASIQHTWLCFSDQSITNNHSDTQCGWLPLLLGLLFNAGYIVTYLSTIYLNYSSSRYPTIAASLSSPLAMAYWFIWPEPNIPLPEWWSVVFPALFFLAASVLWKVWELRREDEEEVIDKSLAIQSME